MRVAASYAFRNVPRVVRHWIDTHVLEHDHHSAACPPSGVDADSGRRTKSEYDTLAGRARQIQRSCDGIAVRRDQALKKRRLKQLLR